MHLNPDLKHGFKVIERPRFARRGWPDANFIRWLLEI
jgi:hypothetical protein